MNCYTTCCVKTCNYSAPSSDDQIKFYKLPFNNYQLLQDWVKAINFDKTFVPTKNAFVCTQHFKLNDYVWKNGILELSSTAVPSIFMKDISYQSANFVNISDGSNVKITDNQSLIDVEQGNLPSDLPVIVSVSGTYSNSEVKVDNFYLNQEPYNASNNEYQNHSFNIQLSTETKDNNIICTNSCTVPGDIAKRLKSNSPRTLNIKEPDFLKETEIDLDSSWILNDSQQATHKEHIPVKFMKRLENLAKENKRIISNCQSVQRTLKLKALEMEINYHQLRNKILETEEALLKKGIDTSEYPVFKLATNDFGTSKKDLTNE